MRNLKNQIRTALLIVFIPMLYNSCGNAFDVSQAIGEGASLSDNTITTVFFPDGPCETNVLEVHVGGAPYTEHPIIDEDDCIQFISSVVPTVQVRCVDPTDAMAPSDLSEFPTDGTNTVNDCKFVHLKI